MDRESLTAHVAADRLAAMAGGEPLPERAHGAVLFADIAGFTPLTNSLAKVLGPRRGAEVLTGHLNRVYDALIEQISAFRGSVIEFSGDAVTCWFDDGVELAAGIRRAVTAAVAMQSALGHLGALEIPGGESVAVSVKIGIAAGAVTRTGVGDPDIRVIDVIGGDTVARAAAAERTARVGEVVIDSAAVRLLGADVATGPWRMGPDETSVAAVEQLHASVAATGWDPISEQQLGTEALLPWVDRKLRERPEERVAELRACVTLFIHFTGLEFDTNPRAPEELDAFVRWAQGIVERHGGTLMQITMGDKGSYAYVTFGAPVAREDQADQAVSCALDLRPGPPDIESIPPPGLGVDQGIARAGAYGGAGRRTYGVIGDSTNVAARLMTAARPGQVLVTTRVQRACRRRLKCDALPPLTIKGHPAPVDVVSVVGHPVVGSEGRVFGALVGRDIERTALVTAIESVRVGPGRTVLVRGEAGVGKSHLIDVARSELAGRGGITWLSAAADEARRASLHAFVPMLHDLFYQELAGDPAARRELFELGISSRCDELADAGDDGARAAAELRRLESHLAAVIGIRWPDSPFEQQEPTARLEQSARGIAALVRAESLHRPVVVHVRDAHWLDEDSRRALDLLADTAGTSRLCLLVDQRSAGDHSGTDDDVLEPDRWSTRVELGVLDRAGVARLAATLLHGPVSDTLVERVLQRTQGNALFVEQLVLDVADGGGLEYDRDSAWTITADLDRAMPVTLGGVLASRLDRLPGGVLEAALTASVLGDSFELVHFEGLLAGGELDHGVLAAGETAGIWFLSEDRCTFRHNLLREAAYDMQLDEHLRASHRRAARVLVATPGARGETDWAEVARHEERAGRPARAAARYRRAGEVASRHSASRDALHHHRSAVALATTAGFSEPVLARLHDLAGDAAVLVGDYEGGVEHLRASLAPAVGASPAAIVRRWARLGEALERWGRVDDAEVAFEAGLVALQGAPDLRTASTIYAGLALVHGRRSQLDEAVELAEMALMFAGEAEVPSARAHQCLAALELRRGKLEVALDHGNQSLVLWESLQDLHGVAAAGNTVGLVLDALDDTAAAITRFQAAVDAFEAIGNEHGLAGALDNLARVLVRTGNEEAGMACLERAVEILARIGMDSRGVDRELWQAGSW